MKYYIRALKAEALKLRRTIAVWMIVIGPLAIMVLNIAAILAQDLDPLTPQDWPDMRDFMFNVWIGIMLPLLITLEAALLGNMEHSQNHWKHLYALPIPRSALLAAKWTLVVGLIALTCLLYMFSIPAGFLVLNVLRPGMGFDIPVPIGVLARITALTFAASLLMVTLHTWISLRWKSFIIGNMIGVFGVVFNFGIMILGKCMNIFPWALPMSSYLYTTQNGPYRFSILFGAFGGLILALIFGLDLSRREVL